MCGGSAAELCPSPRVCDSPWVSALVSGTARGGPHNPQRVGFFSFLCDYQSITSPKTPGGNTKTERPHPVLAHAGYSRYFTCVRFTLYIQSLSISTTRGSTRTTKMTRVLERARVLCINRSDYRSTLTDPCGQAFIGPSSCQSYVVITNPTPMFISQQLSQHLCFCQLIKVIYKTNRFNLCKLS